MSGIGGLIGGIVGAVIGFVVGGPAGAAWGWAIGSVGGSLLHPDGAEGPRLEDLKVQTSEYGRPLPLVYGHVGIGGNVIWALDLIEESHTEGGGLFGGGSDVYEYFGTFAVAVAEGPVSFGRIWAGPEKRLIWDGSVLEGAAPTLDPITGELVTSSNITFYNGTEDQEPDPLIVADKGEGFAPAYRGTAYVVFNRFPLKKDSNRIPMLTFEVGKAATSVNTGPENTGATWFALILQTDDLYFMFYYGTYNGVTIRKKSDDSLYHHYLISGTFYHVGTFLDPDRQRIVGPNNFGGFHYIDWTDGNDTVCAINESPIGADAGTGLRGSIGTGIYENGYYIFLGGAYVLDPAGWVTLFFIDPDTLECTLAYGGVSGSASQPVSILRPHLDNTFTYCYVLMANCELYRVELASGLPASLIGTAVAGNASVDPYTGYIWSYTFDTGTSTLSWTVHNPQTLTLVASSSITAGFWTGADWIVFNPDEVIIGGTAYYPHDYFVVIQPDGTLPVEVVGNGNANNSWGKAIYDPTNDRLMGFRQGGFVTTSGRNDPYGLTIFDAPVTGVIGNVAPTAFYHASTDVTGSVDLGSTPLDEVVEDLCERARLDASQIDVTDLADDDVDGYVIGNTTQVKDAILALAPAYFFDGAEFDGKLHFVKRGGDSVVTIPDEDLGASESGSEADEPLTTNRAMDDELPRIVTVKYLQEATKYEIGTRIAKRLVGESQNRELPMDLPMVLSDTKAQEVAEVNLHMPWVGRLSYTFSLPRKYSYLTPTDIVVVGGNTVRLVKITKTADGRLKCEAVHDDANVYVPEVVVTETVPPEDEVVATVGAVTLELL